MTTLNITIYVGSNIHTHWIYISVIILNMQPSLTHAKASEDQQKIRAVLPYPMLCYAVISMRQILGEKNMVMGPAGPGPRMMRWRRPAAIFLKAETWNSNRQ